MKIFYGVFGNNFLRLFHFRISWKILRLKMIRRNLTSDEKNFQILTSNFLVWLSKYAAEFNYKKLLLPKNLPFFHRYRKTCRNSNWFEQNSRHILRNIFTISKNFCVDFPAKFLQTFGEIFSLEFNLMKLKFLPWQGLTEAIWQSQWHFLSWEQATGNKAIFPLPLADKHKHHDPLQSKNAINYCTMFSKSMLIFCLWKKTQPSALGPLYQTMTNRLNKIMYALCPSTYNDRLLAFINCRRSFRLNFTLEIIISKCFFQRLSQHHFIRVLLSGI